jgi:hypothetical protein
MVDALEDLIRTELDRLANPVADRAPRWNDVRARVPRAGRLPVTALRIALAVAVAVAVVLPAVAFSSGVRSFLGFESPRPRYDQAHLTAAAPLPDGRIAHLWVSPSSNGGDCLFVTFDPPRSTPHPSRMFGGGGCSGGPQTHAPLFDWSLSRGIGRTPTVLSGRIDPRLHPTRVVLRWHGGLRDITSRDGYFIAAASLLKNPPFRLLPVAIVAFDKNGRTVSTSKIPSSFLYSNWKREQPNLRVYRRAHGCSTTVVWRCKSR